MTAGMRLALKVAEKGKHDYYPMGAVVIRRGAVISTGFNHRAIHAEESAIGRRNVEGCDIYIARKTRALDGRPGKSKPCPKCMMLLKLRGIRNAFYFENDGSITRERV